MQVKAMQVGAMEVRATQVEQGYGGLARRRRSGEMTEVW